jgi:hypothetical protein
MAEIIDRKRREIETNGWTLWSFTYRPMLEDWYQHLQATSGEVLAFCSEGRGAIDPVREGSLSKPAECRSYRFISDTAWRPMPTGVRVPHPFQPSRKQRRASAFVVHQIDWPILRFQQPAVQWLSQRGEWCQSKIPARGVYLIRPGTSETMRPAGAVLRLCSPYLAICSADAV